MDGSYQVKRRKACDLCYHKKIKCDMIKPTCTNCQLYKAECRTPAVRKSYAKKRANLQQASASFPSSALSSDKSKDAELSRIESMEARLATMEGMVTETYTLYKGDQILNQPGPVAIEPPASDFWSNIDFRVEDLDSASNSWRSSLPPLSEIQPAINRYFTQTNTMVPLFSQPAFTTLLEDFYSDRCKTRLCWAAINVVLALSAQIPDLPSRDLDLGVGDDKANAYLKNVRSVVPDAVLDQTEFLSLQVILGQIILCHTLRDTQQAVALIGIAVRLAHRLRLHVRNRREQLSQDEITQRNRVFWITYIFDRDICLRHHTPSLQNDADIDLSLPDESPADGVGNIYTSDGSTRLNFFRARVYLAHIQGRVYSSLFSPRASKLSRQELSVRIAVLHKELENWRTSLPIQFQAEQAADHLGRHGLIWVCMMHFTYLSCLVMVHGIWSHDAEWRRRFSEGLSIVSSDLGPGSSPQTVPKLPDGWQNCVSMSRNCMKLIQSMPLSDCSVWANGCAYFSALLILEANFIESPLHENVNNDLHLTSYAIGVLDRMSAVSLTMAMKRMNIVAAQIDRRARQLITLARRASETGLPLSPVSGVAGGLDDGSAMASPITMQWDWANDGVEAWPSMDVTIANNNVPLNAEGIFPSMGPFAVLENDLPLS